MVKRWILGFRRGDRGSVPTKQRKTTTSVQMIEHFNDDRYPASGIKENTCTFAKFNQVESQPCLQ